MTKDLETAQYYIVEKVGEVVVDGKSQAEFIIRNELWSGVYGDCLVDTEIVFRGNSNEVQQFLSENKIEDVIAKGI